MPCDSEPIIKFLHRRKRQPGRLERRDIKCVLLIFGKPNILAESAEMFGQNPSKRQRFGQKELLENHKYGTLVVERNVAL